MRLKRLFRHLFTTRLQLNRAFPKSALREIEEAIQSGEKMHAGEVRFAVESSLEPMDVLRGQTPRARAIEIFSTLRIWDTEHNCGLLIYVLMADHAVEIVADRGLHGKVGETEWVRICNQMEVAFRRDDFRGGVIAGIEAVTQHLQVHFPVAAGDRNELSNRPVVMG